MQSGIERFNQDYLVIHNLKGTHASTKLFVLGDSLGVGCPRPIDASSKIQPTSRKEGPKGKHKTTPKHRHQDLYLPAPKDLLNPPADAEVLRFEKSCLDGHKGTQKPGREDVVQVHYTGWDKAGKMFDSSVTRGTPATFPLNRVIPGTQKV